MLSSDDHSGLFTLMVCVIVLVMGSVGFSILVDRRLKSSTSFVETRKDFDVNAHELDDLKLRCMERAQVLADSEPTVRSGTHAREKLLAQLESLQKRRPFLVNSCNQLKATNASLEEKLSNYRREYRRKIWMQAVGEKLGDLTISGGREYRDVTITRVTEIGLEISHENGLARIQAPDLGQDLQNRFQWSDEERRQHLKNELELDHVQLAAPEREPVSGDSSQRTIRKRVGILQDTRSPADKEKVRVLRHLVSAWHIKINQLKIEKSEASSRAAYDKRSSVPRSLETWSAKEIRLANELANAIAALAAAKLELAQFSPADSLLKSAGN